MVVSSLNIIGFGLPFYAHTEEHLREGGTFFVLCGAGIVGAKMDESCIDS